MGLNVKLCVGFLLVALIPMESFARSSGPARYTLHGSGTVSIDGVTFERQPFVLDMEGLGRNLSRGIELSVPGKHPDSSWFKQDPLSRIVFNLGSATAVALNPLEYQLLATNYGHNPPVSNIARGAAITAISICGTGLELSACREAATLQLGAFEPIDFGLHRYRVPTVVWGDLQINTTLGSVQIQDVREARLQIEPPQTQPPVYAPLLAGLSILIFGLRHRTAESG